MTGRAFALAILLTCSAIGSAGVAHGAPAPTHPAPPSAYGAFGPARTSAIDRPTDARHFSGGSQGRLVVTSNDSAAMPNEGLRLNMTPFTEAPLPADASFQAAVEETIGNHDAVFGMFVTTGAAPVPFFSVFSNTTDATEHLAYWPAATPTPEGTFDFELTRTNSTVWTLDVNHGLFGGNTTAGTFDFGANASTWLPGLTFSEIALYPSVTSAPDTLSVPLAFAVLTP
ncbi:MAG: hypothetical protein L3J91_04315, partial [Thermoplasmata archaeon]|nr:hypothetical protein [Thermoplasmata archaeon]